ncbi:MAG TPA: hypothetical protein VMK32_04410 [Burkholderiaceae bacterium]|nr:hypothetical protein [Burkholderiaceae bacterium]
MTDQRLKELVSVCTAPADKDGKVKVDPACVMELVSELRELRKHAADLRVHQGAIANLHQVLLNFCSYAEGPIEGGEGSGRIAIQDPGR